MRAGDTRAGPRRPCRPDREPSSTRPTRIVAMAGVHPFIELLRAGRRRDHRRAQLATAACSPRRRSTTAFRESQAYYLGKVLECASFCAEPYGGKETVLGEVTRGRREGHRDASRRSAAPSPRSRATRCTSAPIRTSSMSPAARSTCRECRYEQVGEKTTRITGARFVAGAGVPRQARRRRQGRRALRRHGRHPRSVHDRHVDAVIAWAREQGARALRRAAATSCTTPCTAATASWASSSRCATGRRTSCASWCRASRRRAEMAEEVVHDRHAPDVLRAPARREGLGRLGRVRARRGAAREPGATAGRSTTRCAATIRSSCSRRT